jgi:hypothetical protein
MAEIALIQSAIASLNAAAQVARGFLDLKSIHPLREEAIQEPGEPNVLPQPLSSASTAPADEPMRGGHR